MRKIILGALAHVDAGKTTLCEALLYKTNTINNKGRVDHADSFLDFNSEERNRGITIYNKEARFSYLDKDYIYLDTPGHFELRSEASRAIKVIDVALLIIDGSQNISTDTISTFNNLLNYHIPIILFINKSDISYVDKTKVFNDIKNKISEDICTLENLEETVALNDEDLLEQYLEGNLDIKYVKEAINNNEVIPLIFGSALKDEGIDDLLNFIDKYIELPEIKEEKLNAYVYKVNTINNEVFTHLKVLSGTLHNKEAFNNQKINEIRLYSGLNYKQVQEVEAGDICAVKGLNDINVGTYIPSFINENSDSNQLLTYELKTGIDVNEVYHKIEILNQESPELNIELKHNHIYLKLSGDLHKEIITKLLKERFDLNASFSDPVIFYKETILNESYGVGHFEPLRHYAEVIVSLKPIENGLRVKSLVNNSYTGTLINYLENHHPRGILTNSYLTNLEITIVDYKTHPKHTEGGDLINALRRAIRHALSKNESALLEPYYLINIDCDSTSINQIIPELNNVNSIYSIEEDSILAKVPLKQFNSFILSLRQRLKESLSYELIETVYDKANNQEEIIEEIHYDFMNDLRNPAGSIFTSKGAGHYVDIDEVEEKMHLNYADYFKEITVGTIKHNKSSISEDELKRVWNTLYKPKERVVRKVNKVVSEDYDRRPVEIKYKPIIYIVDGYNLMYSIEDLKDMAASNFFMAREKVIDIVSDFKGYVSAELIVVFDAYKQDYKKAQVNNDGLISVVYTKANQTADSYIEEVSKKLSKDYKVITVTSDYLEQIKVLSNSSLRLSSREFMLRYESFKKLNNTKTNIKPNRPLEILKTLMDEE
ncbi:MAG: NYN domain-containing protein [Erysipelotrichaceae bacterium]|nr:NYN domain-containing protein [Erysipelotrichaceae bacterium]